MVLHKVDEANATKATYMMRLGESTGTSIHIRTALHLLAPVVTSVTARGPFGPDRMCDTIAKKSYCSAAVSCGTVLPSLVIPETELEADQVKYPVARN